MSCVIFPPQGRLFLCVIITEFVDHHCTLFIPCLDRYSIVWMDSEVVLGVLCSGVVKFMEIGRK